MSFYQLDYEAVSSSMSVHSWKIRLDASMAAKRRPFPQVLA